MADKKDGDDTSSDRESSDSKKDDLTKAVTEMNGSIVGSKPLYVALAQRKEERRAHLTNQHMQRMATSRVPAHMQLPYHNHMGGVMPYITPMGPSQPRNYYPSPAYSNYRTTPRWTGAAGSGLRQPGGPPMIAGMPYPQSIQQQRTAAMGGLPVRHAFSMGNRPQTPGQMINNGAARGQPNVQQQAATYTRTARNLPQNNAGGYPNSIVVAGQEPLTPAALANATPQEQKQMLGERLFPLIQTMQPDLAGKITGMLLEIDNTELLHMLESRESLKAKVEEAIAVLQAHQNKQLYAAKQAATNSSSP